MTFEEKIYVELRKVPRGMVTTYKALAEKIGTKAYRAVGQAMRNNPYAPEVPCHRVVRSDARLGGFMGKTEGEKLKKKIEILKSEGVEVSGGKIVEFQKILFR